MSDEAVSKTQSGRPWREAIGPIGIWSAELRFGDREASCEAAAQLDDLGYGALWVPGGLGGDILERMAALVDATSNVTIASAIINIWNHEPAELGQWWKQQGAARQERLLLGLGVSHVSLIGKDYVKPLAKMRSYIDELEAQGIPRQHLCVAAFRPRMMALAGEATAGAHPYLVTPEHTAWAREALGLGPLLAPGQAVAMTSDPVEARTIARGALSVYLPMENYQASWRQQGFTNEDFGEGSDRLCDALIAWGEPESIAIHVRKQLAAGADHVCLKVVRGAPGGEPMGLLDSWRQLAKVLL